MQYPPISLVPDVALPYSSQVDIHDDDSKMVQSSRQSLLNTSRLPNEKQVQPREKPATLDEVPNDIEKGTAHYSHEMIATINTRNTLSVAIIDLLRRYHQMKQSDIVAIIGKNVDHLTKNCGRHYSGSAERIVSGALYASKAFVQIGHSLWTIDPVQANELEREIYERFLERETHRKRKRHTHTAAPPPPPPVQNSTEQIELCLARALREMRSEQQKAKQGEADVLPFLPEGGAPLPAGEEPEQFQEHAAEDPFSFLQQDPFESVSIQDCMHEMTLKLGDEGFCFVMQFFNYFRQYLTDPAAMASRAVPRIDTVLEELRDAPKTPAAGAMVMSNMEDMADGAAYEGKRRRASIQEDTIFNDSGLNLSLGLGLSGEPISGYASGLMPIPPVTWQSSLPREGISANAPVPRYFVPIITPTNPSIPISMNMPMTTVFDQDPSQSMPGKMTDATRPHSTVSSHPN